MAGFWRANQAYAVVAAVLAVVLFGLALVDGHGLKSFVLLGAAVFWVAAARFAGRQARSARRQDP